MNIPHITQTSKIEKKKKMKKGTLYYNVLTVFTGDMHL